jgi:predicted O-methyltransferase YrrM
MIEYKFSVDFSSDGCVYENLVHIVNRFGIPTRMLEIGTYEGLTSFWFSDMIRDTGRSIEIHVIDPHVGSNDLTDVSFIDIKQNFLHNLSVHKGNVNYIQKYSTEGLLDLISKNMKFNLIYIDGDHRASQVLTDLVLSWQLIDVGGLILCDDCTDWMFEDSNGFAAPHMSPRMAVESFLQCNWNKIKIVKLPNSSQTAFLKIKE